MPIVKPLKMSRELRLKITSFFDFWRKKHEFIYGLDLSKRDYEIHVLLWASLDALSILWSENFGKEVCKNKNKRRIFDAFLVQYGDNIFQFASLPDIWDRVDQKNTRISKDRELSQDVSACLQTIGDRQTPTHVSNRQLRQTSDDWSMRGVVDFVLRKYPLVVQKSRPESIDSHRKAGKAQIRTLKPRKYVGNCLNLP